MLNVEKNVEKIKLDGQVKMFGMLQEWPDMNNLCFSCPQSNMKTIENGMLGMHSACTTHDLYDISVIFLLHLHGM